MNNTCILIPAYNCEKTISKLLSKIILIANPDDVIVINDGSTDNTEFEIKKYSVTLISHSKNRGKGASLQSGIKKALSNNYGYIITMDGDGQHSPSDLNKFIEIRSDIAIGCRDFKFGLMPTPRIFSNWLSSFILSKITHSNIKDSQNGFRKFSLDLIKDFTPNSIKFQYETEMLLYAVKVMNGKVTNIPIQTIYSEEKSNIRHIFDSWEFIKALRRYI